MILFVVAVLIGISISSSALQITQIEFDLHLAPGASDTYTFQVINNESDPQDVTVYVGDWTRTSSGDNDFLTLNSACWLFSRAFSAGEELDIRYRALIPTDTIIVNGIYACGSPSAQGQVVGEAHLLLASNDIPSEPSDGLVVITRTIISTDTDGTITVNLHVHALQDFGGLRIDEVFSSHVDVELIDDGGEEFSTVSRSCGDWITTSPQSFRIAPGATQPVSFRIDVPNGSSGMYWAIVFVQGAPRPQQREGATVLAIERFGVKTYETIPGSEVLSGEVKSVRVVENDPLTFDITFANTRERTATSNWYDQRHQPERRYHTNTGDR